MNNKKTLWLTGAIFIFLTLFLTLFLFSVRKKEDDKNLSPTKMPLPTTVFIEKKPSLTPTRSTQERRLINVKNKLIDGFRFEDIILDYRQKSDLIIVFYPQSKEKAKEKVKRFFNQQGINDISNLNFEYIGLKKEPEEPPAGFFR